MVSRSVSVPRGRPFHRILHMVLCCVVLVCVFCTPVSASGGNTGSEAEGVAVSMYDVSTALTAFANNVVGSNTNDKHVDHQLKELKGNGSNRVQAGDAGAILGYGDSDKGFYGYISSSTSQAATSTDYDALLSLGDGGNTYAYARYGRLLTDLGLDDTSADSGDAFRRFFGLFMRAVFGLSAFVPQVFSLVLSILAFLNPFRFFLGTGSDVFNTSTGMAEDIAGTAITGSTHTLDASMNHSAFAGLVANTVGTEGVGGIATQAVGNFTGFLTDIYNVCQGIGIYIVIPMLAVILIWQVLVSGQSRYNRTSNAGRAVSFLKRLVLMIICVPLCGVLYTSTLDSLHDAVEYKAPNTQMTACTFVDFQSWVDRNRLALPSGVSLVSVGKNDGEGEAITAAGSASNDTVRTLRDTVLKINYDSGILATPSSLGIGGNKWDYSVSGGIYDTSTGQLKADTSSKTEKEKLGSMLDRYASGNFYHAAAFETGVNGQISANFRSNLGATSSTTNAGSNEGTIQQMYDETNDAQDWMDRDVNDNLGIFAGNARASHANDWANTMSNPRFNIFSNGVLSGSYSGGVKDTSTITYTTDTGACRGGLNAPSLNPANDGGLSSVSMYNYLSTKFDDTSIMTYSAERSTSEYVREAHFAVNLIGSGFLRVAYGVNAVASLAVFVMIGFIYGFGMLVGNLKRGIQMMLSIPMAAAGVFKSLVQVLIYTIVMIAELMVTVFVYQVAGDLIMLIATITETVVNRAAKAATAVGGITGMIDAPDLSVILADSVFSFMLGIFALGFFVILIGAGLYQARRVLLSAYAFFWERVYCFAGFSEFHACNAQVLSERSPYVWDMRFPSVAAECEARREVMVCGC